MSKSLVIAGILLIAGILAFVLYEERAQRVSVAHPEGIPYELSPKELRALKLSAESGDCKASYRLALYYMYGALQPDEGIKWLRVAAKCPDANPKEYLAFLLSANKTDPAAAEEVQRLIAEIRELDPERADDVEQRLKK